MKTTLPRNWKAAAAVLMTIGQIVAKDIPEAVVESRKFLIFEEQLFGC